MTSSFRLWKIEVNFGDIIPFSAKIWLRGTVRASCSYVWKPHLNVKAQQKRGETLHVFWPSRNFQRSSVSKIFGNTLLGSQYNWANTLQLVFPYKFRSSGSSIPDGLHDFEINTSKGNENLNTRNYETASHRIEKEIYFCHSYSDSSAIIHSNSSFYYSIGHGVFKAWRR